MPHVQPRRLVLGCLAAASFATLALGGCLPAGPAASLESASPARPSVSASPAPPSPTASPAAARIPLSGAAPDAVVLDGDRAWVLTGEGGSLVEVDLAGRREVRAIEVGFGATHLAILDGSTAAVGRFDSGGNGAFLVLVDLAAEEVTGVPTEALGGLALGADGVVWALELAGRLLKVDVRAAEVLDSAPVEIGQDVHTEVQWGAGSAWVGSDGTPTLRLSGDDLAAEATIDVPTGLPFLFRSGVLWGAGPTALWAIDPATNEIVRTFPLEDVIEVLGLDIDGDDAWMAVRRPGHVGRVLRLDLATATVAEEHDVSLPAAVRLDSHHAWVASYLDNELVGFPR